MFSIPTRAIVALTLLLSVFADRPLVCSPPDDAVDALIEGLGSDSYQTRRRSSERILEIASQDSESARRVLDNLRDDEYPPQDLELYLAKQRLASEIRLRMRERSIDRFLHDPSFDRNGVEGWSRFRNYAGASMDARLVFVRILRERPEAIESLTDPTRQSGFTDLDRLDRNDALAWSTALVAACTKGQKLSIENTMRLNAILRNPGSGPQPNREHEEKVISRLIASYLRKAPIDVRDRIVIGLRFRCHEIVETDCRTILGDSRESPSRITTALLAASAIDFAPKEIDQWIDDFEKDSRTSHVWRSMVPPKTTLRTQIRDVAMALKLHRQGIDPRQHGFTDLQADPLLVFRAYSLGFASDETREAAHAEQTLPNE